MVNGKNNNARDLCEKFTNVICFEPSPQNAECLELNLKNYNNYKLYKVALSNTSGTKKLLISDLRKMSKDLNNLFTAHYELARAKMLILKKLQALNTMPSFIKTDSGYRVTDPEGFVAIDRSGKAVKLVDRMEFSRANFNVAKDWTK